MNKIQVQAGPSLMKAKLDRIRAGGKIRTLDLFAGCGGIAAGFHAAGFNTVGSVEFDPNASRSFALNFMRDTGSALEAHAAAKDITKVDPAELIKSIGIVSTVDNSVDVLIGGPPCQAFARVGRAKLREVDDHPNAFKQDPRGNLYLRYIAYIRETRPLAILMENVPDVLNYGGHNVPEEVCEILEAEGYRCQYTLLNSVFYGVPQMRERMFLVAIHEVCDQRFSFPHPTHWCDLPAGYTGTRNVALKTLKNGLPGQLSIFDGVLGDHFFVTPPRPSKSLRPATTAQDALSDLPRLNAAELAETGELRRGAKRFNDSQRYYCDPKNGFQRLMRGWPGFPPRPEGVFDHVIRYLPRDFRLFALMKPGWQYPELHAFAEDLFEKELPEMRRSGMKIPLLKSRAFEEFKARYVPPYDPTKFPNKWRKMEANRPARTLLAHLGKDSYTHIHYDNKQGRTISVREGARLQSFPDGFVFDGTINPAFKQIGNAVPPLISYAIAREMMSALGIQLPKDIRADTIL